MSFSKIFKWRKRSVLERKGPAGRKKRLPDTNTLTMKRPKKRRFLPIAVLMILWIVCVFTILYSAPQATMSIRRGMEAPTNYVAQIDFSYVDQDATEEARQRSAEQVLDYYRLDTTRKEQTLEAFRHFFQAIQQWSAESADDPAAKERSHPVDALVASLDANYIEAMRQVFVTESQRQLFLRKLTEFLDAGIVEPDKEWITDRTERIIIVDQDNRKPLDADRSGVNTSDLMTPQEAAEQALESVQGRTYIINGIRRDNLADVLANLVRPNLSFDAALRTQARESAMATISPEKREVKRGMIFIERDKVIAEQDMLKMQAHAAAMDASRDLRQEMKQDLKLLAISLVILISSAMYVKFQHVDLLTRKLNVIMLGSVVSFHVLLVWGVEELMLFLQVGQPFYVHPALPLTLSPLLIALLVGRGAGLSAAFLVPTLLVVVSDKPVEVLILAIVTSVIGVLAIYKSRTRVQTFRAALWILLGGYVVQAIFMVQQGHSWQFLPILLGIMAASAFLTILLVNVVLPLCEFLFRLTTNISLLELSDLNHPLLKRLQMEAPGTYHHTLMVATLAEHAAEAVGANTLLTRVASYFHDIGKLANPSYFTENSYGQDRHEELSPRMSSMVILNHVKEGLVMAAKYKLKEPLREAIATHHGTSLVYFFYRRALDNNQINDLSDEESYRYPGPAPQSREASIISIADSCEAASRSLQKPTPQKIDTLVDEIFHNKMLNGQLDDSQLTMAELKLVVETIKTTLHTMLHGRVAYPKFAETDSGEFPKKMASRKPKTADQRAQAGTDTGALDGAERPTDPDPDTDTEPEPEPEGAAEAARKWTGQTTIIEPRTGRYARRKNADKPGK